VLPQQRTLVSPWECEARHMEKITIPRVWKDIEGFSVRN
jgi:hypothetical protein